MQRLARTPVCIRCGAWFGELRPVDFNRACPDCNGQGCQSCHETGLMPQASSTCWAGLRFTEFLQHSVDAALELFINSDQAIGNRPASAGDHPAVGSVTAGGVGLHQFEPSGANAQSAAKHNGFAWD